MELGEWMVWGREGTEGWKERVFCFLLLFILNFEQHGKSESDARPWCFCTECKYPQRDVMPRAVLREGVAPRIQVLPLWVQISFFNPSILSMARKPAGMSRSCDPRAVWRVFRLVIMLWAQGLMFWF